MVDVSKLAENLSNLTIVEAKELATRLSKKWAVTTPSCKKHQMTAVEVGQWERDEDNPIFPGGANPKRLLICPNPASAEGLIAGHRYLFKISKGWKAGQVWSEYAPCELGAKE